MARKLDPVIADMECIPWWGAMRPDGYGDITVHRSRMRAHRFIWQECFGPIGDDQILHHVCQNKACVNPAHLAPLSRAEHNTEHGSDVDVCPQGHEYTPENTYWRVDKGRGWKTRKCRACHRRQEREAHRGKAA